ncbi:carboxymuconolactone decarboxylase family protein [Bordetella tumbae]
MSRIELPDLQTMSPEQACVCEEAKAGPRGKIPAPMIAWLQNAELARRAQHLGALLRFQTSLSPRLSELAILVCARHWTSHHEWTAHKKIALDAGLDPGIISTIASHGSPVFREADEELVYQLSSELLKTGKLSQASYEKGTNGLGTRAMVELVAILGYYCLVSLTLNAFELGLPDNTAAELADSAYTLPKHPAESTADCGLV